MSQRVTLQQLANATPWPIERLQEIEGQCMGSLLKDWAVNLNRRWGAGAEQQVRDVLPADVNAILPSSPTDSDRLPAWLSICTSDIVIASFLRGDRLALEECLWEDIQRSANAAASAMLRLTGPKMVLKHVSAIHQKVYDIGEANAEVKRRSAVLHTQGSPLFGNPTWQLTQFFFQRMLVRACKRQLVDVYAEMPNDTSFILHLHWK